MTSLSPAEPWYVARGKHGQELLDAGRIPEAIAEFEAVLERLGREAGYGRAVVLERLGRALLLAGDHAGALRRLRESLDMAGRLAPTDALDRLRCTVRSGMGDALRAGGHAAEARRAYLAALELGRKLRDVRSQGIDEARIGALALQAGDLVEARERYQASLDALRRLKEPAVEAVAWDELGRVYRRLGEPAEAARHLREAVECERRCGPSLRLARRLIALAEHLRLQPDGGEAARQAAAQALAVAQHSSPTAPEAWTAYALLGELHPERADLRELARRAPAIVAAAERVGDGAGVGRPVLLARLGRCFAVGGRPDLAATHLQQAVRCAEDLPGSEVADDLLGMLWAELGDAHTGLGRAAEAGLAFASSLRIAERTGDLLGLSAMTERLGRPAPAVPPLQRPAETAVADISVVEETKTSYAFDPNLLLEGPRTRRLVPLKAELPALPDEVTPLLVPSTRTWADPDGRIHFAPPAEEPRVITDGECTVLRRSSREVAVAATPELVWGLVRAMDGHASWSEILAGLAEADRGPAAGIVSGLAAAGVVDVSGRPWGRFIHWTTRKGVLPAGGLEGDDAFRLAAGTEPAHADVRASIPLGTMLPEPLAAFHALTRARRSTREYHGDALSRAELDALLATACGVTGVLRGPGGEVRLRAYPSSGALYAVRIYPVVFRVEGLEPAVHRLDPDRAALDVLGPPALDPLRFLDAALPMEREMMAKVAMMVCLTGVFLRHERKYGEGGYRMLVAEAGHVSQNLVLAATALGLGARPFGGVFDSLVDRALGLDGSREQFLLSVLVGR